jgi:hypothetical protein
VGCTGPSSPSELFAQQTMDGAAGKVAGKGTAVQRQLQGLTSKNSWTFLGSTGMGRPSFPSGAFRIGF